MKVNMCIGIVTAIQKESWTVYIRTGKMCYLSQQKLFFCSQLINLPQDLILGNPTWDSKVIMAQMEV